MNQLDLWFGRERLIENEARVRAFWGGAERFLISVDSQEYRYRQSFDADEMLRLAPLNLRHQAELPGINLPSFYPDYGTISTAKYWGGTTRFDSTGGNIFCDPVAPNVEAALAISPLPPDHPTMDGYQGVSIYHRLCEHLESDALWFRSPDMQGPLNTAALVVDQPELLMSMVSEPEAVHSLLDGITDWEISYGQYLRDESNGRLCGNIWPYTVLPIDLGLSLTEDMMPLLSTKAYRTFAPPYLERLDRAFGGLLIHCCGDWGRHAQTLADADIRLRGAEFHYPFTTIEELAPLADSTVFIPYISLDKQSRYASADEYYRDLLENTPEHYRYWFPFAEESDEALAFCRRHGFGA